MRTIEATELLKKCGLQEDAETLRGEDSDVRHFSFFVNDYMIEVESTATNVMDEITRLKPASQRRIFMYFLQERKDPGDSMVLVVRKAKSGRNEGRKAHIVRLKSTPNIEHFLISR